MPSVSALNQLHFPVAKKSIFNFQGTHCINKAIANRLFATLVIAAALLAGTGQAKAQASAPAKGETPQATEQKTAESEATLQRQEVAHLMRVSVVGELSGAIAHEINQPLAEVQSNAETGLDLGDPASRFRCSVALFLLGLMPHRPG